MGLGHDLIAAAAAAAAASTEREEHPEPPVHLPVPDQVGSSWLTGEHTGNQVWFTQPKLDNEALITGD